MICLLLRLTLALCGCCALLQAAPAVLQSPPVALQVDRVASRVNVDVKVTVDSFVGQLRQFSAKITVDPASGSVTSCTFAFRLLDLKTGKDKRDRNMHDWQGTAQFPEATFVLERLEPAAGAVQTAYGQFTFHGVTRPLSFPVTITQSGRKYEFDGEAFIDTRDFGLPIIRMLAVIKVDPKVKISFHLEASR